MTLTIADQLYSNVKAWPADRVIIKRTGGAIEAPIPPTCREMLMYVTGANMVHDRLGEAIALGKLPATATAANLPTWQKIDQERYELVKQHVIAEGNQPIGKNYSKYRKLVDFHGARRLAESDKSRLEGIYDGNGRMYDGFFIDNFDTAPFRSFPTVNVGEHYYAMSEYLRTAGGINSNNWVNMPIPHCFYRGDGKPDAGDATRAVAWAKSLGVRGIYYETNKYAAMVNPDGTPKDERRDVRDALEYACRDGLGVACGFFDANNAAHVELWSAVSANGTEFDVYRGV